MDFITKNNLQKQNFSLFIRDLSQTLNSNLKHIIEDTINDDKKINISWPHKPLVISEKDLNLKSI